MNFLLILIGPVSYSIITKAYISELTNPSFEILSNLDLIKFIQNQENFINLKPNIKLIYSLQIIDNSDININCSKQILQTEKITKFDQFLENKAFFIATLISGYTLNLFYLRYTQNWGIFPSDTNNVFFFIKEMLKTFF
jgi:hypothetical protein